MADFPTSVVALTNPVATDTLASPSHSGQHGSANDEIEAIETTLGVNPQGEEATVGARLEILKTYANVKSAEFGAVGDDTADDTAALAAAEAMADVIYYPPGIYKTTADNVPKGRRLHKGGGRGISVIHAVGADGFAYTNTATDFAECFMAWEDLTIRGDFSAGNVGLRLKYTHYWQTNRVIIEHFGGGGVDLDFSFSNQMNSTMIRDNDGNGITLHTAANTLQITSGSELRKNNGWGLYAAGSAVTPVLGVNLHGAIVENNRDGGVALHEYVRGASFEGAYFENNFQRHSGVDEGSGTRTMGSYPAVGRHIWIGGGANAINGVDIRGCNFIGPMDNVNVTTGYDIDIGRCVGVVAEANHFAGSTRTAHYRLDATNSLQVYGLQRNSYGSAGPTLSGIVATNGTTGTVVTHNLGQSRYHVVVTPRYAYVGTIQVLYGTTDFTIKSTSASDTGNCIYTIIQQA